MCMIFVVFKLALEVILNMVVNIRKNALFHESTVQNSVIYLTKMGTLIKTHFNLELNVVVQ